MNKEIEVVVGRLVAGLIPCPHFCQQLDPGGTARSRGFESTLPTIHSRLIAPARLLKTGEANPGERGAIGRLLLLLEISRIYPQR
jgi:hypothetical protein